MVWRQIQNNIREPVPQLHDKNLGNEMESREETWDVVREIEENAEKLNTCIEIMEKRVIDMERRYKEDKKILECIRVEIGCIWMEIVETGKEIEKLFARITQHLK